MDFPYLWVGVQLQVLLSELERCEGEDHCLSDAVRTGANQLVAALNLEYVAGEILIGLKLTTPTYVLLESHHP